MNYEESYIEILISKHLDGEISASEQRHLQEALDRDPKAQALFEQLSELYRASQLAVDETIQGRPAEDIVQEALALSGRAGWSRRLRRAFFSPFTTGLAAGLLAALSLQMVLPARSVPRTPSATDPVARTRLAEGPPQEPGAVVPVANEDVNRAADLYYFIDGQGRRWLVEGLREGQRLQPVNYRQDF